MSREASIFLAGSPSCIIFLTPLPGGLMTLFTDGGPVRGGERMQQKGKPRKGGKMVSPLNMSEKEPFLSRLFMSPSSSQFNLSSSAHLSTFTHPSCFFLLWPLEQVSECHTKLHYFPLTWVCRRGWYLTELNMDLAERRRAGAAGSTVGLRMKSFLAISYPTNPFHVFQECRSIHKQIRGYSKVFNQGNQCCFQRWTAQMLSWFHLCLRFNYLLLHFDVGGGGGPWWGWLCLITSLQG